MGDMKDVKVEESRVKVEGEAEGEKVKTEKEIEVQDAQDAQDAQDDLDALEGLESEAKEFMKDSEIDRILKSFRLDAYAVLDLQPGVGESDIKKCYRVKSLLIHPDKTRNPLAPDAFDRLKKAQTELMDEKHRERLDEAIADARMLIMREKGLGIDSIEVKEPNEGFKRDWREKTKFVLIENEQRRRRQVKAQMQEEGREMRKVEEEQESRKRKRESEVKWEASREERIGSWREFAKKGGGGGGAGGAGASGGGSGNGSGGGGEKKKKKKVKPLG
ncbi:DnaJ domain-containing protein [Sclerotinia borealis F-4128]|uniref:DnaJ domain-containing protein n=1 Tax=Sclerotinia borealis (strain F-4128) TaxID=1432307 RepID=W9CI44_SCLBF|nr:DnaJ domain-containing protein [Sclerotinia borealis F-4128]